MDVPQKDDVLLLADEKFDFDLSLSSSSANEDDEVFFGPIGHKERCIAASLELNNQIPEEPLLPASESHFTWSPLTGEKFVEVYKEAHLLALQIQSHSRNKAAPAARQEDPRSQGGEGFIQESQLKIHLFEKENETKKSPKSLKRETYYLPDSPLRGLPPSGPQPTSAVALQVAPARASLTQTQGPPPAPSSSLSVEPSTAHPPNQAVTQNKVPSKLPPPRTSSLRGKSIPLAVEKPVKEKSASPSRMKTLSEKESHSHVPPDKPSAARDVTSLPAGGSHLVQGKRSLPVPNKLGPKKTVLRPPGCAGSLAGKASSAGSFSGVISSVCASPAAGKAKASDLPSIPADSSRANTSQLGRTGLVAQRLSLQAGPGGGPCGQSQRPAELPREPTRAALTQPQTPELGGPGLSSCLSWSHSSQMNKTGRRGSCLNSKTKVMPTPTHRFKVPKFSTGEPPDSATPKSCRAQRPQSCTSVGRVVHSTPVRRSSGPASQSLVSSVWTPVSTRRVSALPTPAGRRLSSLPVLTPKTLPRALASPLRVSARRLSSEPQKKFAVRTAPATESARRAAPRGLYSSPDGSLSPPSAVPQALNFSPEKSDLTFSKSIGTEAAPAEVQPPEDPPPSEAVLVDIKLDGLSIAPEAAGTAWGDRPLIHFCDTPEDTPEASVAVRPEGGPLVDLLLNTPDANRKAVAKPPHEVAQLIDLASPLILLSPEADKENVDSPLLKF
nr:G2 and S phase-expressed protein 1 [Camelus dromedarius]